MSELVSILFAAIFASSMGLNHAAAGNMKTEPNVERPGLLNVRPDFKHAENIANLVYKASIVACKKKPASEKAVCLNEAKTVNEKAIAAAKQTATTTTASSAGQ